jgi:cysteine desulfurase/selenocysteine lyase
MVDTRRDFLKLFGAGVSGAVLQENLRPFNETIKFLARSKADDSEVFWKKVSKQFEFQQGLKYFNNGSLGACPMPIREATNGFRKTLDNFPSKYMWGGWEDEKEETRSQVASVFNVSPEEIALIHNTTEGMNLIARSFDLKEGDEVILGDHEHTSGSVCWKVFQESRGVKIVRPEMPLMPSDLEEIVEVYRKAITPQTKVISMCHMVNTNGMILPVKAVSKMAHERGIFVAVDGAQSAGMIKIDLKDLGCDFYTASAHKWLFAPKGIGIFYAKESSQELLKPLIVCRGYQDTSIRRLENYNTRNLPELLGLGAAIEFHNGIGDQKIHDRTYELKDYFISKVADNPKLRLKTPSHDELSAGIQVVEVVGQKANDVRNTLLDKYKIDCRPMNSFDLNALRISLAIFCTKKDVDKLFERLEQISA